MYGVREDEEKSEGENVHHIQKEFPANGKYQQGHSPILLNIESKLFHDLSLFIIIVWSCFKNAFTS